VRVVSRNFPLEPDCNPEVSKAIHPGACLQAAAAECAEEQGRLDDFAGRLFDSKARDEDALAALAEGLGLDLGAFRECLSSDRPYDGIRADVEAARNDGVTGTPSVFVEGRRVLGPITRNSLRCLER
jgi:predicted DsbA family dithiol-disulfide isomerase